MDFHADIRMNPLRRSVLRQACQVVAILTVSTSHFDEVRGINELRTRDRRG